MFTQTDLDELRKRNEVRLAEAKEKLGTRWLLHPQNQIRNQHTKEVKCPKY